MDLGTIIIGLIFVGISAAFFMVLHKTQHSRRRQVLANALSSSQIDPQDLGDHSMTGNVILGWLSGESELFFYRKGLQADKTWRIRLADLRMVKLEKEVKSRTTSSGNYSFVDAIKLRCLSSHSGQPDIYLPLFVQEEDAQVGSELKIGQEWTDKINSRLKV